MHNNNNQGLPRPLRLPLPGAAAGRFGIKMSQDGSTVDITGLGRQEASALAIALHTFAGGLVPKLRPLRDALDAELLKSAQPPAFNTKPSPPQPLTPPKGKGADWIGAVEDYYRTRAVEVKHQPFGGEALEDDINPRAHPSNDIFAGACPRCGKAWFDDSVCEACGS